MARVNWQTLPTTELGSEIERKITEYNTYLLAIGRWDLWRRMLLLLYGADPDSGRQTARVTLAGVEGEIVQVRVNPLMKMTRAYHTLVVGSRPAFEPRTSADDSAATETATIGKSVLEYSLGKRGGETEWKRSQWYTLMSGEGWVYAKWDPLAGKPVMADEMGKPVFEGDVCMYALRPDQVVRDVSWDGQGRPDWLIVHTRRNRWVMAAEYPEWADHIAEAGSTTQLDQQRMMCFRPEDTSRDRGQDDMVDAYSYYFPPSPALPEGRMGCWVAGKVVHDDVNTYGEVPVYPNVPNRLPGTPMGYSHLWDLLGLQQISDAALTALVTVVENYGLPSMWKPPGVDNGSSITLAQGLRLITSTEPPQLLEQMGTAPAQIQAALEYYMQLMVSTSGLNDVAIGDAGKSQSGAALAMQHSLAVQDSSDYQSAAQQCFSDLGNGILNCFKRFATGERVITLAGNGKRGMAVRFNRERLAVLDGVDVNVGTPVTQSAAGRYEIMSALLTAKVITAEQFMKGLASGSIEPLTEAPLNHRVLIESENERLRRGEPVKALATDNHAQHIREHLIVLDDQDIRADEALAGAALAHITEHTTLWTQVTQAQPDLLAATGQQPAPSVVMQQQAMAAQAAMQAKGGNPQPGHSEQPNEVMEEAPNMPQVGAGGGVAPGAGMGDLPDMPQVPTA